MTVILLHPDAVPVPHNSILRSVRSLHETHLGQIARTAHVAAFSTSRDRLGRAWRDREEALLAYGLACLREWESRSLPRAPENEQLMEMLARGIVDRLSLSLSTASMSKLREGPVPGVLVKYRDPSWMGVPELHARHRTALLQSPDAAHRAWYASCGWRATADLLGADATCALPPHDRLQVGTRWQLDTAKDWGERKPEPTFEERHRSRKAP